MTNRVVARFDNIIENRDSVRVLIHKELKKTWDEKKYVELISTNIRDIDLPTTFKEAVNEKLASKEKVTTAQNLATAKGFEGEAVLNYQKKVAEAQKLGSETAKQSLEWKRLDVLEKLVSKGEIKWGIIQMSERGIPLFINPLEVIMSHFTVMVVGDDVESKLYPYHELECILTRDEIKEDPRAKFEIVAKKDEIRKYILEHIFIDKGKRCRMYKEENVVYNEFIPKYRDYLKSKDYDSIMEDWGNYDKDDEGNYGNWTNSNAKWDWYQMGGRWAGALKLKKFDDISPEYRKMFEFTEIGKEARDGWVDSAPNILIDWDTMNKISPEQYQREYDFWTKYVIPCSKKSFLRLSQNEQRRRINEIEKSIRDEIFYNATYYKDRYQTCEKYIRLVNIFSTYAVITEDGLWHAPGDMGCWGCSNESHDDMAEFQDTFFERFIKPLSPDTMVTVVDCHI